MVWRFDADRLETWEITTATCLRASTFASAPPPAAAAAAFTDGSATVWIIRPGHSARSLVAHSPGTVSDVRFRPLSALPARCQRPVEPTTSATFEVFERTMREQYAFFALRRVDWEAQVTAARRRLPAIETPGDFYDLLTAMVAPLEDLHTDLTAPDLNRRVRHYRRSGGIMDSVRYRTLLESPPTRYLLAPLEPWCQGWIQYGELPDSIGYLRVMREYAYTPSGRFEDDSAALTTALDSIMPRIARRRGLVLDLRLNGGGADAIALMIVARLTERPYLAFGKQTRAHPVDPTRFTPLQPIRVVPAPGARFGGPVVLLIGPRTLSAGEVLTLALIGRRPRILRVGEATQGIFADELLRRLPNGWRFQLSTERYLLPEGTMFEGAGIPPDHPVPLFQAADLAIGRDPALDAALNLLVNQPTTNPR
ncbi:MAG: S41 family peptidase [Gemmatimonadales bacterium]|nr:S41 family peptidase [Gemmatimonadales bacterium]